MPNTLIPRQKRNAHMLLTTSFYTPVLCAQRARTLTSMYTPVRTPLPPPGAGPGCSLPSTSRGGASCSPRPRSVRTANQTCSTLPPTPLHARTHPRPPFPGTWCDMLSTACRLASKRQKEEMQVRRVRFDSNLRQSEKRLIEAKYRLRDTQVMSGPLEEKEEEERERVERNMAG